MKQQKLTESFFGFSLNSSSSKCEQKNTWHDALCGFLRRTEFHVLFQATLFLIINN